MFYRKGDDPPFSKILSTLSERAMLRFCFIFVPLLFGCTHTQLRFNTLKHAETAGDLHTKQVLDNLAKFAQNPYALPHFEYPTQGTSQVTDQLDGSSTFNFSPHRLTGWSAVFRGNRASLENFVMAPINDPRKLELMRCVYQQAVGINSCCQVEGCSGCPNCSLRFNKFYLGKESGARIEAKTVDGKAIYLLAELDSEDKPLVDEQQNPIGKKVVEHRNELDDVYYRDLYTNEIVIPVGAAANYEKSLKVVYVDNSIEELSQRTGKTTIACIEGPCWFKVGKKCDVPKSCRSCGFVGHYCDTYVWVPECGRDQLTKVTLTILDIAMNDPPKSREPPDVVQVDAKITLVALEKLFALQEQITEKENALNELESKNGENQSDIEKLRGEIQSLESTKESVERAFDNETFIRPRAGRANFFPENSPTPTPGIVPQEFLERLRAASPQN